MDTSWRSAPRVAVSAIFVVYGLCIASWAVHIPVVTARVGISTGALGGLLLLLGAGALTGMQVGGAWIARRGSGPVTAVGATVLAVVLTLPLTAPTPLTLAVSLAAFGMAAGVTDVAMNARAVTVEQRAGRPIISSVHAMFSVGSVVGSLIGAALLALRWPIAASGAVVTALCLVLVAASARDLLGTSAASSDGRDFARDATDVADRTPGRTRRLLTLAAVAFVLYLAEGSAMDWSALHAQRHLGTSAAVGALVFACFVTAMTIGRFSADAVTARKGPVWVIRYGSLTAATGLLIVVVSSSLPLAALGWVLVGIGLAGGVPLVFSAAGNVPGVTGRQFSRVIGGGYLALLSGPALIGGLAELVTLDRALLLPLAGVVLAAAGAAAARPSRAPA